MGVISTFPSSLKTHGTGILRTERVMNKPPLQEMMWASLFCLLSNQTPRCHEGRPFAEGLRYPMQVSPNQQIFPWYCLPLHLSYAVSPLLTAKRQCSQLACTTAQQYKG
jgi:hypothetical protein